MVETVSYRGRFAPSPTGPLHFGSLVAALGSWLDARSCGGEWLLRIEDVDRPRSVAGAEAQILAALEAFGLHWDGAVLRQSDRSDAYEAALDRLRASGDVYACNCTRSEIEAAASRRAADGAWVYPGTCRERPRAARGAARAWRLRLPDADLVFADRLQGRIVENLARDVGDIVLKRADGLHAYQLAVVVDDAWQGVTDVVRGADLLGSTARQIALQRCLGLATPRYLHLPLAVNAAGEKLSKQTLAPALDLASVSGTLAGALSFLGHPPAPALRGAPAAELLDWACAAWSIGRLPTTREVVVDQSPRP